MASVNACMNLFGLLQEEINLGNLTQKKKWSPFWFGCFAGIIPWAVIFANLGETASAEMPGFVWAVLFSYLAFFNTFPVNMFC